jgi:hypothetical protein
MENIILWLWGPVGLMLTVGAVLFLTRHNRTPGKSNRH